MMSFRVCHSSSLQSFVMNGARRQKRDSGSEYTHTQMDMCAFRVLQTPHGSKRLVVCKKERVSLFFYVKYSLLDRETPIISRVRS